jgi:hypothetical protein
MTGFEDCQACCKKATLLKNNNGEQNTIEKETNRITQNI